MMALLMGGASPKRRATVEVLGLVAAYHVDYIFLIVLLFSLVGLIVFVQFQKKDSSLGASSDKSSVVKSNSTPSTPQAESVNLNAESRVSQSLLTERTNSTELSPLAGQDRETHEDFSGQETPLVSRLSF